MIQHRPKLRASETGRTAKWKQTLYAGPDPVVGLVPELIRFVELHDGPVLDVNARPVLFAKNKRIYRGKLLR